MFGQRVADFKLIASPRHADLELLFRCAVSGDVEGMTILLDRGLDVKTKDQRGYTALHRAANHGHLAMVKLLLERGALLNEPNDDGHTPLDSAESTINVETPGEQEKVERCKIVAKFLDEEKKAVRGVAKGRPKPKIFSQPVASLPWNQSRKPHRAPPIRPSFVPPLSLAQVVEATTEAGTFLSPQSGTPHSSTPYSGTPRTDNDSPEENLPTPSAGDEVKVTAAFEVKKVGEENIDPTLTALFTAIAQENNPLVARLLQSGKINVNGVDGEGYTPLHRAAQFGHVDVAGQLIAAHANLNAIVKTDEGSFTPLDLAARGRYLQTSAMLVAAGAKTHHEQTYDRDIEIMLHPENVTNITAAELASRTQNLLREYKVLRQAEAGPFLKWAGLTKTFKSLCSKENKILIADTCFKLLNTHEGLIDSVAVSQALVLSPDSDLQKIKDKDESKLASAIELIMNDKRLGEIIKMHNKLVQLSVPRARACC